METTQNKISNQDNVLRANYFVESHLRLATALQSGTYENGHASSSAAIRSLRSTIEIPDELLLYTNPFRQMFAPTSIIFPPDNEE